MSGYGFRGRIRVMGRIRPVTENDRGNQDVTVHRQEVGKETIVVQLDNNQTISYICNHLFDATDSQEHGRCMDRCTSSERLWRTTMCHLHYSSFAWCYNCMSILE